MEEFLGTERFEVVRRLGAGGMGVVYEAVDRDQQRRVALKTLHRADPDALLRLKREFRALRDLHHPNLVTLGELIEESGAWFFTMELIRGQTFLDWVRGPAGSPLDEPRVRDAFAQLVAGLAALHERGKVHRDIKPSNILVNEAGRVIVLDLGLVTDPDPGIRATGDGVVIGTIAYMAPEQAAARPVDGAADLYSVGVILYEVLTGTLPFDGQPLQIMIDKQVKLPDPPGMRRAGLPAELEALCVELLDVDPARRPGTAAVQRRLGHPGAVESERSSSSQVVGSPCSSAAPPSWSCSRTRSATSSPAPRSP